MVLGNWRSRERRGWGEGREAGKDTGGWRRRPQDCSFTGTHASQEGENAQSPEAEGPEPRIRWFFSLLTSDPWVTDLASRIQFPLCRLTSHPSEGYHCSPHSQSMISSQGLRNYQQPREVILKKRDKPTAPSNILNISNQRMSLT